MKIFTTLGFLLSFQEKKYQMFLNVKKGYMYI